MVTCNVIRRQKSLWYRSLSGFEFNCILWWNLANVLVIDIMFIEDRRARNRRLGYLRITDSHLATSWSPIGHIRKGGERRGGVCGHLYGSVYPYTPHPMTPPSPPHLRTTAPRPWDFSLLLDTVLRGLYSVGLPYCINNGSNPSVDRSSFYVASNGQISSKTLILRWRLTLSDTVILIGSRSRIIQGGVLLTLLPETNGANICLA